MPPRWGRGGTPGGHGRAWRGRNSSAARWKRTRQLGRDHLDLVNLRTLSVSKPVGEHFAVLAIPGTSSLAHLAENIAVGALRLNEEEQALLGSLA